MFLTLFHSFIQFVLVNIDVALDFEIHPSIVNCISRVGSQGQQLQQRAPGFPFSRHVS